MPLKIGTQDIPRIFVGDKKIKRAYQGNDLVYGLYDVHYYDREGIDTSNYIPKEYAWGYKLECVDLPVPYNSQDSSYAIDGYPTHYGDSSYTNGWYIDSSLTTHKNGSINTIDLNDKQDFDFYAKWRQHKYSYDGIIYFDRYRWVEDYSGGGDDPGGGGGDDPGGGDLPPSTNGLYDFAKNWAGYNRYNLRGKGNISWQGMKEQWCAEFTWWSFANVLNNSNYYPPPSIPWYDPPITGGDQAYRAWAFMCAIWSGKASGTIIGLDSKNGGVPQKDDLVIFYDPIHLEHQTDWAHVGICSGNSYGSDDYEYVSGNLSGAVVVTGINASIRANSGTGWQGYVLVRGFKLN